MSTIALLLLNTYSRRFYLLLYILLQIIPITTSLYTRTQDFRNSILICSFLENSQHHCGSFSQQLSIQLNVLHVSIKICAAYPLHPLLYNDFACSCFNHCLNFLNLILVLNYLLRLILFPKSFQVCSINYIMPCLPLRNLSQSVQQPIALLTLQCPGHFPIRNLLFRVFI